jgi:hypothetical protein
VKLRYLLLCTLLGLVIGWFPILFHGPIPEKFDAHFIQGSTAVWAFYLARLSIGFWVGMTHLPPQWYLRGPIVGFLVMLPVTFVSLATPGCGRK